MVGTKVPREFWNRLFDGGIRGMLLTDCDRLVNRLLDLEVVGPDCAVASFALARPSDPELRQYQRIEVALWCDTGRVAHAWLTLYFHGGLFHSWVVF